MCHIIWIENLNSSNKRCTIVYKTNFNRKLKWAKVKNRLQQKVIIVQMKQLYWEIRVSLNRKTPTLGKTRTPGNPNSDSTPLHFPSKEKLWLWAKPRFWGTLTPIPHPCTLPQKKNSDSGQIPDYGELPTPNSTPLQVSMITRLTVVLMMISYKTHSWFAVKLAMKFSQSMLQINNLIWC